MAGPSQSNYSVPRARRSLREEVCPGEGAQAAYTGVMLVWTIGPGALIVWAIEGYEPLAEIGRGSTGLVIIARDSITGAAVAIKYLTKELCESPDFLVRYRGEVAMLGLIEHPQVANVYELVERGGAAAVVTELVDGVSLRRLLEQTGALEPQAALYVVKGVLLGLGEVHGSGIVHGALKPENVLIDTDGNIKIVDIGVTPPSHIQTHANPVYASPELWSGGRPTLTSDVYAATAILFECLSGQPPHGTGGAHLGRSGQAPEAAIDALAPDVAPHQVRVFMTLGLAVDPLWRPVDARAALQQIDIVALSAFGSAWYDTGHDLLRRRLSLVPSPVYVAPLTNRNDAPAPPAPSRAAPPDTQGYVAPPDTQSYVAPRPSSPAASPVSPVPAWGAFAGGDQRGTSAGGDQRGTVLTADSAGDSSVLTVTARTNPAAVESAAWGTPEGRSHRDTSNRMRRILVAAAALVLLGTGTAFALTSALGGGSESPTGVETNSHQPLIEAGPTVPVPSSTGPGADTTKPAAPAGLRVTGRSVSAVSINWAASVDNIGIAGYIVLRNGKQVGTTYDPGFTDRGLQTQTRYRYAVAAFDAAGNISATSAPVSATTLMEPDVSPPSIPTNLHSTGKSTTTIVLAWSASHDNVGVAGYEVYRNGTRIANVVQPGFTDTGRTPATAYTYKVRAFDTSDNASADSNAIMVTTLPAPDTTPPTTPVGVDAANPTTSTIDVSWNASTDNVGVTGYRVFRDGMQVAVTTGTTFTDIGLAASTTYGYSVRAVDAAGNVSGMSGSDSESTLAAPTTPPPTTEPSAPVVESVALSASIIGCTVTIQATVEVSGPMAVELFYDVTGPGAGSVIFSFADTLPQTKPLPDGNGTLDGSATASAGGKSDTENWSACITETPSP